MVKVKDELSQGLERKEQRKELEYRIGSTRSGSDWLRRIGQIGKASPELRDSDQVRKESNGEDATSS